MRLFVAMDIPEDVRSAIRGLTAKLRPACRNARWPRIEGLHVTLKFIGETPPQRVAELKVALGRIPSSPFIVLNFRGLDFFPNARRPRVLWADVEAGPDLGALASAVEKALSPAGVDALQVAIEKAGPQKFGSATAKEFHLYQSVLKPGGAEYTRLATFSLSGSTSE